MKIHFVTEGSLNEYWENSPESGFDVLFFGFNGLGDVDYGNELGGKTSKLEDAAILSRELGCVIVCGCYTDSRGVKRKSAVVADKGKILGVSDMVNTFEDSPYAAGGALRVYETSAGKLGILVAEDLFFPETAQSLSAFDADVLLCVFGEISDFVPQLMMRADAFVSGVAVAACAKGSSYVAGVSGEMLMTSPRKESDFSLSVERQYHIVSRRRRGFTERSPANF